MVGPPTAVTWEQLGDEDGKLRALHFGCAGAVHQGSKEGLTVWVVKMDLCTVGTWDCVSGFNIEV